MKIVLNNMSQSPRNRVLVSLMRTSFLFSRKTHLLGLNPLVIGS